MSSTPFISDLQRIYNSSKTTREATNMALTSILFKQRIEGLLESTKINPTFLYIPTDDNPADRPSRRHQSSNMDLWVRKRVLAELSRNAENIQQPLQQNNFLETI
eukprot:GHVP01024769.1.p2 GENE.GHVP01024769.1~~GHVP01024769.1.p2  ORF type:complete len:105 (-),score=6.51 GHVP01024769.1:78-392(-)